MFERYTESARRAVFFARYEAAQNGSPHIETAHLLLGILHDGAGFFSSGGSSAKAIGDDCRKSLPPSSKVLIGDLPLANACKRVAAYAFEEAERLQSRWIGPQHLVLGLIRENDATSEILKRHGITLEKLRSVRPTEAFYPRIATPKPADAVIEFVCENKPVATASVPFGTPQPRVGEGVVLRDRGTSVFYKVIAVRHHYADIGGHAGSGGYRLVKLVVEVKSDKRKPRKLKSRKQ